MTSEEEHVDLSGLLLGELTNIEVNEVADHLDWCEACRVELAETATGHALLTSAARRLGPVAQAEPAPPLPAELTSPAPVRRRRTVLVAAAAAIVAVLGTTGVILAVGDRDAEVTPNTQSRSVALEPVEGSATGAVEMTNTDPTDTTMTIRTKGLPAARANQFYYAWLFDPDTNKMLPLGQVSPGGDASFTLTDDLLERYSAVDVSLEVDDGNPQHSATSVLRASYGANES